jgi:tRNA dimethylallyltransferase
LSDALAVVRLPIIVGPTGVGKSQIAMALARSHPLTIISADSRQIYRGFDVGTAKPTPAERGAVPHEGIDVAAPTERWSAPKWASAAGQWIRRAREARRVPLVVGGTGFYVRALVDPVFEEPPLDPGQRAVVAARLGELDTAALRAVVQQVDPPRAVLGRTQLLRALEVYELTGTPLSEWHRRSPRPACFSARYLLLEQGPADLDRRLASRLDAMLRDGWLQEVVRLSREVPEGAPAWQATGYHALRQVVSGARDLSSARDQILTATRQYAKRQRTWFRHQLLAGNVTRLDATAPMEALVEQAAHWWNSGSTGEASA